MSHSFCIITGGKRAELIRTVVRSIRAQNIVEFEIIIAGIHQAEPGIIFIPAEDAANAGRLGEMRNRAVARARFENIVMLDDDIILAPDWYRDFTTYTKPFDILTSQIRLPDGGRYFDHATVGGPKGHRFLADDEDDDFVYMTGGGGWVMKNHVAASVAWDPDRTFYQEEDVDFSRRCQAKGYKIAHNHAMTVYHADPTYTNIGRSLRRRNDGRSHEWVLHGFDDLPTLAILKRVRQLRRSRQYSEAADLVRMAILKRKCTWIFKILWTRLVVKAGGDLPGTSWSPTGSPEYLNMLETYQDSKAVGKLADSNTMESGS
jgi:glycosyltransferase involved in cell wall biosynthesis